MAKTLRDLRPIYVVGVGLHRYQNRSETPYVELGLTAIRAALADAGIAWGANETTFFGTASLGMAGGRAMLKHLGANGSAVVHLENASASGSAAFRAACIEVASGLSDVGLAVGVDKPRLSGAVRAFEQTGIENLADDAVSLPTHFALVASEYTSAYGLSAEDIALVAEKNHNNGALNPYAQRQQTRTLDEILGSRPISGMLTALQCCPIGEGAAAALVMSQDAIERFGIDGKRAVRVVSAVTASEQVNDRVSADAELTGTTVARALAEAALRPDQLDVIEVHDAFSVEELVYLEAIGLAKPGQAIHALKAGEFHIGGRCAVSASGGLIAMGHPTGPTGVGQIAEITRQLRGEAGRRQQPDARYGLAHMCGLGTVCYAHVLTRA
ncbi:thiolase family protein [Ferrovibrio sp.]|uniref:thiolase family protein n=1 Tax=Ferrovibrio sp. TaxID=1917215 RepID=UPI003D1235AF